MRSAGKAHTLRGLFALALLGGVGGGCFAFGVEFDQVAPKTCKVDADCGQNECSTRSCKGGYCEIEPKPKGTETPTQVPADCKRSVCDGKGNVVEEPSKDDIIEDGNPCTKDTCVDGVPTFPAEDPGKPCGKGGLLKCSGTGVCVGCTTKEDCDPDAVCVTWSCDEGACNRLLKAAGTLVTDPNLMDCKADFCNVSGDIESRPFDDDKLADGNPCTVDACKDGSPVYPQEPNGTPCGSGCQMCVNGVCGGCDTLPDDFACNNATMQCVTLKKQENGSACASEFDCLSGICVDGVCCDSVCNAPCMACSNAKTGQANGTCSPVATGTDPDNDCQQPEGDVCNAGKCQCYNGIQDGAEFKTDCGGVCTPCTGTWQCDGMCETPSIASCCFVLGCNFFCVNETLACKDVNGKLCTPGVDADKTFDIKLGNTSNCDALGVEACLQVRCYCK
jgi:hypothetical protein